MEETKPRGCKWDTEAKLDRHTHRDRHRQHCIWNTKGETQTDRVSDEGAREKVAGSAYINLLPNI